jgi:O-antigen/teichoic acid export membrane protein
MGVLFYALRRILLAGLDYDDYGLFYVVFSAAMVVQPLLAFGFDPGLTPFVTRLREEKDPAAIKQVVLSALTIEGLISGILVVAAFLLAKPVATLVLDRPDAAVLIRIMAVHAGIMMVVKNGTAMLLGLQSIGMRSLADLARVAVCPTVALLMLQFGYGVEAAAYGYVAGAAASLMFQVIAIILLHPPILRAPFRWRPDLVAEVFRSGKYLSLAYGGVILFSHMDTTMLGVLGALQRDATAFRAAGAYQVAVPTTMILYSLIMAVGVNFMPMVTTLLHRNERERLAEGIARIYELAFVVVLPATILMACFSDVLMALIWRTDVLDAPSAFNILAVGSIFYFTCYFNLQILAGMGHAKGACAAIALALVVNLVFNVILILWLGIRGAAMATVLSHIAATSFGLRILSKELGVRLRFDNVLAAALVSVVVAFAAMHVRTTTLFLEHPLGAAATAAIALYLGSVVVLDALGFGPLRELTMIILRRRV